jgi:uncharacterized protein YcbX
MNASDQSITPYNLAEIWRYPVKGFPGQRFASFDVFPDRLLPGDRSFAVSNGHPASHKKLDEGWLSKRHFVQLLSEPRLAGLTLAYDDAGNQIQLSDKTGTVLSASAEQAGPVMERLRDLLPGRFQLTPRLCRLNDSGYTDTQAPWISIGGTASIADFGHVTHTLPDNRRFRLNLVLETQTPFEEFDWAGKHIQIGDVELEVIERVGRCAAINIDHEKIEIKQDHLRTMRQVYGHTDLGMFARIVKRGTLVQGADMRLNK